MNADHAFDALGPCEDREFECMEFVDDALPPDRTAELQRHLVTCACCRHFVQEMAVLDGSLGATLPRAQLSAGFEARLATQVSQLERTRSKDTALVLAEREYRQTVEALRRGLRWRTALNALATASVSGGVLSVLAYVAPQVMGALDIAEPSQLAAGLGIAGLAAVGGILAGRLLQRPGAALA